MAKRIIRRENADQVLVFCGEGLGIAGLPHRVTLKQAEELGLLNILETAIERGSYRPESVNPDGESEE